MTPAARLLTWYDKNGRDLPWRRTRDPYRILVSEIMLQQTQVPRVMIFYAAWLKRFPDWESLAHATNADVIKMWAGLGYNRRALVLRDIAREIVTRGVPMTEDGWRALKGIGPYTAAAIACFSFHERTIPIDTNIRRVLSRLLLGKPYPPHKRDDRLTHAAMDRFLPRRGRFYDIPQALFDLATAVCTKTPACSSCPMRSVCPAAPKFLSGRVRVPKQMIKKAVESKHRDKKYPDRIYRGRILKAVREHPRGIQIRQLGALVDPDFDPIADEEWIHNMVDRLAHDGLIQKHGNHLRLPSV